MRNWTDLSYLQRGNPRQQCAYVVLDALGLWKVLAAFGPVLAGTIPLDIDIPGSDLDVLCEVGPSTQSYFEAAILAHYGHLPDFKLSHHLVRGVNSVVASFSYQGMAVEVFGQALPAVQQHGFRHMLVEHAILEAGGVAWRRAIRQLKTQGLKTEPAFATLLQLPGDPYAALLTLEGKPQAELRALLAQRLPP